MENNINEIKSVKDVIKYGLIFNDSNEIFLGKYESQTIKEFILISDDENVYKDLPIKRFSFVEVKENIHMLRDICEFEIQVNEEIKSISDMLNDMEFPSEKTDRLFHKLLMNVEKEENKK